MTSNTKITDALGHIGEAHLLAGQAVWILRMVDMDGGFHGLTDRDRAVLDRAFQAGREHFDRAAAILADLAEFQASVKPHRAQKQCDCGQLAMWEKTVPIGQGGRRTTVLYLCHNHLLDDHDP